ncbi:hypothetical protein EOM09_07360 [bacterium]|nr:hypothetical protein [bacterium]
MIGFVLEGYSVKNEDKKKSVFIQSPSEMKIEIEDFQKRIDMFSKEKKHKEKDIIKKEGQDEILAEKVKQNKIKIKTKNPISLDTLETPVIIADNIDTNIVVSDKSLSENYNINKSK